ncbi:MAG: BadF/BadG/BcrA/BcrD ATPase family protein [Clostridia bacterium]|nr:BadF/BadG/BcrA/BcrD ATPase family protein [Clostridia bacterium]
MNYLGVDCGGTKTLFIVATEEGKILASYRTGSGSFFGKEKEGIRELVAQGAAQVCRQAGIDMEQIDYAGLGFPGYGEKEGSEETILAACEEALLPGKVVCACDCALGWAGSLAMEPGINVIAGTGSNCYGVNERGESARASGWGACCDEGSCRWIGNRLIQIFAKQADGRLPRTLLYDRFREHFHIQNDTHFVYTLNHEVMRSGSDVAQLQRIVKALYDDGDPYAGMIYREAAKELALTLHAVAKKLNMGPGYAASYSGGLFQIGEAILEPLRLEVAMLGGKLCAPRYTPEQGAVLMAMRAVNPEISFDHLRFTDC